MFPWLGWKGMSMEGLSICGDVSPFNLLCIFLLPNMVGEQEEGEKEGSQERRMKKQSSQHFLSVLDPF